MPSVAVADRSARLDAVLERGAEFHSDPEVQADYTRYLCILVAGFIERSVEDILQAYVDQASDSRVSRYVSTTLRRSGNLRAGQIVSLFEAFDDHWKARLNVELTTEHRQAIGNVYANRNQIAHGEDVDLTYRQIQGDYERVKAAVDILEETAR